MENEAMKHLLKRYLEGKCTPQERLRVEQWYEQLEVNPAGVPNSQMEGDIDEVRAQLLPKSAHKPTSWYRYAAAIAALLVVTAFAYVYWLQPAFSPSKTTQMASTAPDLVPGGNRATLKLADGTEIPLDDRSNGEIARDGNQTIYKNTDGQVVYQHTSQTGIESVEPVFNTLSTPRGGQYHMILPDGTKVWLNAASTLTYAINQTSKERLVKLQGEAYFEVARDAERPFRVASKGQVVEVLGTEFNVSSYPDESNIKTTLVQGAVKVVETSGNQDVVLVPGQQAVLDHKNQLSVASVNVADAMAWKDGKFNFNQSDIGTVVRQLSRWYDVEVVFQGNASHITLSGEVYRNTNASKVLEILSFYNLDCRIDTAGGTKRIMIQ